MRDEIDACAKQDNRTRSNWIVNELWKRVRARQAAQELEAGAPKPLPFPSTADSVPRAQSLNEPAPESPVSTPTPRQNTRRAIQKMVIRENERLKTK